MKFSLYNSSTFFFFLVFWDFHLWKKKFGGRLTWPPLFRTWRIKWRHFRWNRTKFERVRAKTKLPIQKSKKFRKICQFLFFRATTPKTLGIRLNWIIQPLNRPWQINWRWVRRFWTMPSKDIPKTKQKISKSLFFGWGAKYLSMVASHGRELSANRRGMVEIG